MRFTFELDEKPTAIRVFLSERNLKALLAKLAGAPAHSARTISYRDCNGVELSVTAEDDATHYSNPERDSPAPGRMHPETEAALRLR